MSSPPSWALAVADFFSYHNLRPTHPTKVFRNGQQEPLPQRVERLRNMWQASGSAQPQAISDIIVDVIDRHETTISEQCRDYFIDLAGALAADNAVLFDFPHYDLSCTRTASEADELVANLVEIETRLSHEQEIHREYSRGLSRLLENVAPEQHGGDGTFEVPLYTVPGAQQFTTAVLSNVLYGLLPSTSITAFALSSTRRQLWYNIAEASNLTLDQLAANPNRATYPDDSKLDPADLIAQYLGGTPFYDLAMKTVPFSIPDNSWTEHALVLSPSGHGKTQLLQSLILGFLEDADPPGMFIIDDQDDANGILNKIQRLAIFHPEIGRLRDRLLILSPEDEPSLNFFKLGDGEMTPDMLSCFIYLFSTLDASLSSNQSTAVTFILRLIEKIPGANLSTLLEIMDEKSGAKSKYAHLILQLDPIARSYFETQFYNPGLKITKDAVCRRLYSLMSNQTFVEMFSAPTNCFDAALCMREKKIVLINASTRKLGDASTVYARFFISQILAAAVRRGEDTERPLSLLIIDEAGPHLDTQTERLLAVARKYQLGLIAATQMLEQIDQKVKAAMYAGTRIKFVGPVSHSDASILGREMYTTADFIRSTTKTATAAEWACFVRGETAKPVKLTVPFGKLEDAPQMSATAHKAMRENNQAKVHTHIAPRIVTETSAATASPTPPAAQAAVATPVAPLNDPSKVGEW